MLLIVRAGAAPAWSSRLAAAGRMAFSNYLMTSIITTLVFCGFGLGLYGKLSRFEQLAVVAGRLGLHPDLEQALAGALPLRALRVGLAFAGEVEAAAVRARRDQAGGGRLTSAAGRVDPPPRIARLVLVTPDGSVVGSLPPMPIATPWWQDIAPVVAAAREQWRLDILTVLRLLTVGTSRTARRRGDVSGGSRQNPHRGRALERRA